MYFVWDYLFLYCLASYCLHFCIHLPVSFSCNSLNLRIGINMNMLANLTHKNIPAKGVSTYLTTWLLLFRIAGWCMDSNQHILILSYLFRLTGLTSRCKVLLKKLTIAQLVKKSRILYLKFIIVFTWARHRLISWPQWIQSITFPPNI